MAVESDHARAGITSLFVDAKELLSSVCRPPSAAFRGWEPVERCRATHKPGPNVDMNESHHRRCASLQTRLTLLAQEVRLYDDFTLPYLSPRQY